MKHGIALNSQTEPDEWISKSLTLSPAFFSQIEPSGQDSTRDFKPHVAPLTKSEVKKYVKKAVKPEAA